MLTQLSILLRTWAVHAGLKVRVSFDVALSLFSADPDPTARQSVWSLVVGGAIGWMAWYGVNQASVQRYCALPSLQKAKG